MALIAYNEDNMPVKACYTLAGVFHCPFCLREMILKKGQIVIPHFAHLPDQSCGYGDGETEWHWAWKMSFPCEAIENRLYTQDLKAKGIFKIPDVTNHKGHVLEFESKANLDSVFSRESFYGPQNLYIIHRCDNAYESGRLEIRRRQSREQFDFFKWFRPRYAALIGDYTGCLLDLGERAGEVLTICNKWAYSKDEGIKVHLNSMAAFVDLGPLAYGMGFLWKYEEIPQKFMSWGWI